MRINGGVEMRRLTCSACLVSNKSQLQLNLSPSLMSKISLSLSLSLYTCDTLLKPLRLIDSHVSHTKLKPLKSHKFRAKTLANCSLQKVAWQEHIARDAQHTLPRPPRQVGNKPK